VVDGRWSTVGLNIDPMSLLRARRANDDRRRTSRVNSKRPDDDEPARCAWTRELETPVAAHARDDVDMLRARAVHDGLVVVRPRAQIQVTVFTVKKTAGRGGPPFIPAALGINIGMCSLRC
jgi:hypothetical protein